VTLLSFSVLEMLPMIRAGLRQRLGEDVGAQRVKRQTFRKRGTRAEMILKSAGLDGSITYDLHLWWKSRTPQRERIGNVAYPKVYPVNILHSRVEHPDGTVYPVCRIDGPRGWRDGDTTLFWSPGDRPNGFAGEAYADGFDSPEAFRDYFVPNIGDRFDAILYKW
jgi:hypothetical protein